ncbi:MAG: protein kinase [Myxococcota bacterium]
MGLVHRDLSPENVVVSYDGAVKVIDLGLATTHTTAKGEVVGKPTYMAPEQARGERVDRRADVFSAGVICWELASRGRMWGDLDPADIILHLRTRAPLPALDPMVEPALAQVIGRALSLDPDARFSTSAEFAAALRDATGRSGTDGLAPWMAEAFTQERRESEESVRAALAGSTPGKRTTPEVLQPTHTETPRLLPDSMGTLQDTMDGLCRLEGVLAAAVLHTDQSVRAVAAKADAHRNGLVAAARKVAAADDVVRTLAPSGLRSTSVIELRDGFLTSRRGPTGSVHLLALRSASEALIRVGIHAALLKLAEITPMSATPDTLEPDPSSERLSRLTSLVVPELGPLAGLMVRRLAAANGGHAALASPDGRTRMARELLGHLSDARVRDAVLRELGFESGSRPQE